MNSFWVILFFLAIVFMVAANVAQKKEKKIAVFFAILGGCIAISLGAFSSGLMRVALGEGGFSALIVAYSIFAISRQDNNEKEKGESGKEQHRISYAIFSWVFYVVMLMATLMIVVL